MPHTLIIKDLFHYQCASYIQDGIQADGYSQMVRLEKGKYTDNHIKKIVQSLQSSTITIAPFNKSLAVSDICSVKGELMS